ncbi:MAG: hypothetical protein AB7S57_12365 [Acetobacteraceae bacterium]
MPFKGRPPGSGAGDMSKRTEALRPTIMLTPKEASVARRLRRNGLAPEQIAEVMDKPLDDVEKALVQMRMPRPETTRGTLNVTLAAHRLVMQERRGDEPIWVTFDRMMDELLRLRAEAVRRADPAPSAPRRPRRRQEDEAPLLPLGGL